MFFEVLNDDTNNGEIGLATSLDGLHWNYEQIVLMKPGTCHIPLYFNITVNII